MWWALLPVASAFQPPMVVGGVPAPSGRWPDAVALYGLGGTVACTGVLVAPDLVLTAGHCGVGIQGVLVGTQDLRSGGRVIGVESAVIHERPFDELDVTLVVLDEPVPDVEPRLLVRDCLVDAVADGTEVAIVGWGATDEQASDYPNVLMEARTTIRDADCSDLSAGCYPEVSPGGELLAGGGGVDSCTGDSGGPLYLVGGGADWLVGITSRAAQPAGRPCGDGGIYVRADAIAAWVAELGIDLPRPDCEGFNLRPAPSAEPIVVRPRGVAATEVAVTDDAGDTHVLEVVDDGGRLEVWTDGLRVGVRAGAGWSGSTSVRVRVTDDGTPPLSAELEIPVEVIAGGPSGGCATVGGGPWALAALALARRRRRC